MDREAYPDLKQFDQKSEYFDPKATKEAPRWFAPDLKFVKSFKSILSLEELRAVAELAEWALLKRGNRLSVLPVTADQFSVIEGMVD